MRKKFFYKLVLCALFICFPLAVTQKSSVHFLQHGSVVENTPEELLSPFSSSELKIYCYKGQPKEATAIFNTILLKLAIKGDDFMQYDGHTPDEVRTHYDAQRSLFSFNLLSTKKRVHKLDPFNQTCLGIDTKHPYAIRLELIQCDFWKVVLLATGLFVFLSAKRLSENSVFYYLTGILLGIFASFVVIIFLLSKLFPKRPLMIGVMAGGWTLGIYFAKLLWENMQMILLSYQPYVFWYVVITGFLSFVICYRMGPPKNQRSKDLIKWGLQFISTIAIFFSSQYQEAAVAINLAVFIYYYFPRGLLRRVNGYWRRRFPPKPKLLTEAEYYEQGARETKKALEELKTFCSSPECKQWKTILSLKDPQRFAEFMEGSSHILDEEILEYETSGINCRESDISDDEEDEEQQVKTPSQHTPSQSVYTAARLRQSVQFRDSIGGTSTPNSRNHVLPELSDDE